MINLRAVAGPAIAAVHPDERVALWRNHGQTVDDEGRVTPLYDVAPMSAQVQSLSDEKLYFAGQAGQNEVNRAFYLAAEPTAKSAGLLRPLARGGDMIQRPDGTWWLVTSVMEDFSAAGWVRVGATLQERGPEGA